MSTETKKNGPPHSVQPEPGEAPSPSSIEAIAAEIATYKTRLPEFVRDHDGDYVLIKGTEVVGFFADDSSAMREGYRRFGVVPLLVKRITADERAIYIPNVVL